MIRELYNFFICPECGKLTISESDGIRCCNALLSPLKKEKAGDGLHAEENDGEYALTSPFPQTKKDFIDLIAIVKDENIHVFRLHPEWDVNLLLPLREAKGAKLFFHRNGESVIHYQKI